MMQVTPRQPLAQIAEAMGEETVVEDLTSKLVRLGARRLVETAILEAEDQGRTGKIRELCAVLQRLW